ncbi:uncharacterized protein LOC118437476 [Folsomia candida]|uniref:uncharacterized protein LOC118437476 n=1 Tax=Folsomia candida TaxID=158441 RepID=UPI0016052433|nr:uncharacterized protein LOC118437476 [Folsomia candida]
MDGESDDEMGGGGSEPFYSKFYDKVAHTNEKRAMDADLDQFTVPDVQYRKVRHHCHTKEQNVFQDRAKYIGAAHANCNLNCRNSRYCTIIFHNLTGFDSKLLILAIAELGLPLRTISKTSERHIYLLVGQRLRIIDSLAHLNSSLDNLVQNLKLDGVDKFKVTTKLFENVLGVDLPLVFGKLAFPYDHLTMQNLHEQIVELPPIECFYNKLKDSPCEPEEYKNACTIFKKCKCKTLAEFMRVYNLLDCSLLCDVWRSHREHCLNTYKTDPTNYVSLSSMSYKIALRDANATLQFITTPDLYNLTKKAQVGGIVNVSKRYGKANVPGFPNYNPKKPTKYIIQLDVNGLYPHSMCEKLPTRDFVKKSSKFMRSFDPTRYSTKADVGFLIECDLEISSEHHNWFKDLPPFAEKRVVNESDLSKSQKDYLNKNPNSKSNLGGEQLLLTLHNKNNYVLFLPMLKVALSLGVKVKKYHTIWTFSQKAFLKNGY